MVARSCSDPGDERFWMLQRPLVPLKGPLYSVASSEGQAGSRSDSTPVGREHDCLVGVIQ